MTEKVYEMLFDYQGLTEGGMGYIRLMHFDIEGTADPFPHLFAGAQ